VKGRAVLLASDSRYPSALHPVSLAGQSLLSLVCPHKGSPVRARHDVVRRKFIPVRRNQVIVLEAPAGPSRIHEPEIAAGSQPNNLNCGRGRVLAALPSPRRRYVTAHPISNGVGPDAVQKGMLLGRAKCSHRRIIHILSACLGIILSGFTAYNVYYSITYAASILNKFNHLFDSLRMILGRAFCVRQPELI